MFGTRRLAKRSIIGTRVCAPWTDGKYYPGVIQSTSTWPNGEEVYTVLFDDSYSKTYMDKEIIGPGFQPITAASLRSRQKVYITYNGREVAGQVVRPATGDEMVIAVQNGPEGESQVHRKHEDIRLMMSRKSARLQDQDTDYSRLADLHPEPAKKRAVSHVIDVPTAPAAKQSRRRKSTPSPEPEDGAAPEETKWKVECEGIGGVMDEHTAAMVLTSLSCSPVSPAFPAIVTDKGGSSPGGSIGSSGVWGMKSEPSTPSPPQNTLSQSAPPSRTVFGSPPNLDEGIELDETGAYFSEEHSAKRKKVSTRTVYKCTWPHCGKLYNTCPAIEKHVRNDHLGPKEDSDSDSDMSDHEEEFYYTEIEVTVDTVTQTFADMYTSSPPEEHYMEAAHQSLPDHDYQKKEPRTLPMSIPEGRAEDEDTARGASFPLTVPINIPQLSRSLSWTNSPQGQSPMAKVTKSAERGPAHSPAKSHALSSSPKSSPIHKKSRSEVKKCRKVYGMENRDMWCTQCKWKKACTRFFD